MLESKNIVKKREIVTKRSIRSGKLKYECR